MLTRIFSPSLDKVCAPIFTYSSRPRVSSVLDADTPRVDLCAENLAMVDVQGHSIAALIGLDQPLSKVRETTTLFVYELDPVAASPKDALNSTSTGEEGASAKSAGDDEVLKEGEGAEVEEMSVAAPFEEEEEEEEEVSQGDQEKQSKRPKAEDDDAPVALTAPPPAPATQPPWVSPSSNHSPPKVPHPVPPIPGLAPLAAQALGLGYNWQGSRSVMVTTVHRCLDRTHTFFLNPFRHFLFGQPLLMRLPADVPARAVYQAVARRVARLLKPDARPQGDALAGEPSSLDLSKLAPPVPPTDDPLPPEGIATLHSQDAHAGIVPPYGFRLRVISKDLGDPQQHWLSRSVGKLLDWNSELPAQLENGCSLAIDWHLAVLKGCFDGSAKHCLVHSSVVLSANTEDQALSLDKCLDMFAAEEKIEEAYCSKCKTHRHASLKTSFWRLPPVLVVHLKRFSFSAYSRRKLHNLVKFPVDHLDLEKYVVEDASDGSPPAGPSAGDGSEGAPSEEAGELGGGGRSSVGAYELYAVVHHLGAMSSGHYVASIKCRKTGKWHCFNDNIVGPVSEKEVVSESAYILFYMRKDMASVNLDDVYPTSPNGASSGLNEEEFAKMMKKRDRNCQVM